MIIIIIFDAKADFSYLSSLTKIFTGRRPSIVIRWKLKTSFCG